MINIITSDGKTTITQETLEKIGEVSEYLKDEVDTILRYSKSSTSIYVRNYPEIEENVAEDVAGENEKIHIKRAMRVDSEVSMTIQIPEEDIEKVKKIIAA